VTGSRKGEAATDAEAFDDCAIEAESFEVDGLQLVVFEIAPRLDLPDAFTAAERAVGELLCAGHDTAAIAERRGVSYRTVANQLAAMYRKARVHSGVELVAYLTARREGGPKRRKG
jgi:DNA-binding NarL/FixJ family response regulator